ncbi:hypothetical protein QBC34DRAFT_461915, partial [Podospora aff. communis PSN243]
AAALLTQVQGCVYVHTFMKNHPLKVDTLYITARINGKVVCSGAGGELLAGENTKVCLRNHDGQAQNPRCAPGYTGEIKAAEHESMDYKCSGDDPKSPTCIDYDGCFTSSKWGQCPSQWQCPEAPVCDWKQVCSTDDYNIDPPNPFPFYPPPKPIKAMFVGDSITHGADGDFTWRFRMWEWLKTTRRGGQAYAPQFVGPWSGTHGNSGGFGGMPKPPLLPGESTPSGPTYDDSGKYAGGLIPWDTHHAAHWGRQAAQTKSTIYEWVKTYQPEYIFMLIGFNDIGWWVSDTDGTLRDIGTIIERARLARPDVKFLVGNMIHRSRISHRQDLIDMTNEFNAKLPGLVATWNSQGHASSTVHHVDVEQQYGCSPDGGPSGCYETYDGLHPNIAGEISIAQAFTKTLVEQMGIGDRMLAMPNPVPQRPINRPLGFSVSSVPQGIMARWDAAPYARSYQVRERLQGHNWGDPISPISKTSYYRSWVLAGQTWEMQVRSAISDKDFSAWTDVKGAVANPRTPSPPRNVIRMPTAEGIQVSWEPPANMNGAFDRYEVILFDTDQPGEYMNSYGTRSAIHTFTGLRQGHRYVVAVAAWNEVGGGFPATGRNVIPGVYWPQPPTGVRVENQSPTDVVVTWDRVPNVAGYRVWARNVEWGHPFNETHEELTTELHHGIGFLFPGTWNFEFCVTAYNGNMESARSNCVRPERWPGF